MLHEVGCQDVLGARGKRRFEAKPLLRMVFGDYPAGAVTEGGKLIDAFSRACGAGDADRIIRCLDAAAQNIELPSIKSGRIDLVEHGYDRFVPRFELRQYRDRRLMTFHCAR